MVHTTDFTPPAFVTRWIVLLVLLLTLAGCGSSTTTTMQGEAQPAAGSSTIDSSPAVTSSDDGSRQPPANPKAPAPQPSAVSAAALTLQTPIGAGIATDHPLDGQAVSVTGTVARISVAEWFATPAAPSIRCHVWLYGDAQGPFMDEPWIRCDFADLDDVRSLASGAQVTIQGEVSKHPGNLVMIRRAVLVQSETSGAMKVTEFPLPNLADFRTASQDWKAAREKYAKHPFVLGPSDRDGLTLSLRSDAVQDGQLQPEVLTAFNELAGTPITAITCTNKTGAAVLPHLARFPELRVLRIRDDMRQVDWSQLKAADKLERLEIGYCSLVSDELADVLAEMPSLRAIHLEGGLRGHTLTDTGMQRLATLPWLEELQVQTRDGITDEGVAALADAPRLRRLALLYQSPFPPKNGITDAGIASLLADPTQPPLRFLYLDGQQQLTDKSIEAMEGRRFAALGLGGTQVSDAGLQRILDSQLAESLFSIPTGAADEVRKSLEAASMIDAKDE